MITAKNSKECSTKINIFWGYRTVTKKEMFLNLEGLPTLRIELRISSLLVMRFTIKPCGLTSGMAKP